MSYARSTLLHAARCAVACLAIVVVVAGPLRADLPAEPAEVVADEAAARQAIKVFMQTYKKSSPVYLRTSAIAGLGTCVHPKATARLLELATVSKSSANRLAALRAVVGHGPLASQIVPRLAKRLEELAREAGQRIAKADGGYRVDPKTGEADTVSAEGQAHLGAASDRAAEVVALLHTLEVLGYSPGASAPDLTPYLQDASDELVVAVLARIGSWKVWSALPAILDLYRMYLNEYQWEAGAVVDLAGTNASAKAKWMVRFGHPLKRRARPELVEGLQTCFQLLFGRTFAGPGQLDLESNKKPIRDAIANSARRAR